jgi:hypothetical protein
MIVVPTYHQTEDFEITCDCGKVYIGKLTTVCPGCGEFRSGYTNEVPQKPLRWQRSEKGKENI